MMDVSSPILKQYDYRPRKWQAVGLFLLALGGTVVLTYLAITLDEPLNARGFELSPLQARVLFGVIAALSPIGLFSLGALAYVAFAYDRRIALTENHIVLPRPTRMGLSRDEIQIPINTIKLVTILDFIGKTKLLRLDYSGGAVSIPSNMFGSREEFEDLCREVQQAVDNESRDRSASTTEG